MRRKPKTAALPRQRVALPKRQGPKPGRWHRPGTALVHATSSRKIRPGSPPLCCSYVTVRPDEPNQCSFYGASADEGGCSTALVLRPKGANFAPKAAFTDDCWSTVSLNEDGDLVREVHFDLAAIETYASGHPRVLSQQDKRRKHVGTARTLKELIAATGSGKKAAARAHEGRRWWLESYHHYNEVWIDPDDVEVVGFAKLTVGDHGETIISFIEADEDYEEMEDAFLTIEF